MLGFQVAGWAASPVNKTGASPVRRQRENIKMCNGVMGEVISGARGSPEGRRVAQGLDTGGSVEHKGPPWQQSSLRLLFLEPVCLQPSRRAAAAMLAHTSRQDAGTYIAPPERRPTTLLSTWGELMIRRQRWMRARACLANLPASIEPARFFPSALGGRGGLVSIVRVCQRATPPAMLHPIWKKIQAGYWENPTRVRKWRALTGNWSQKVPGPSLLLPLWAQVPLVVAELVTGEALAAQVTLSRHLRGSFFHSQVANAVVFVDLTATVRASGCLISDACISQQMVETGCTHEVSIAALETKKEKPTV